MEPDYTSYTLSELFDVKENIDKRRYPERYQRLLTEITLRQSKNQEITNINQSEGLSKSDKVFIAKVIVAICSFYFSWSLVRAYRIGVIESRGGHEYFLETNPQGFYFIVCLHAFFLLFSIFFILKDIQKNPKKSAGKSNGK